MKILMDLAGPKIRTGAIRKHHGLKRVTALGDDCAIAAPGELRCRRCRSCLRSNARWGSARRRSALANCIFIDDGEVATEVKSRGILGRHRGSERLSRRERLQAKARSRKASINFPDTAAFTIPALTEKDVEDSRFRRPAYRWHRVLLFVQRARQTWQLYKTR